MAFSGLVFLLVFWALAGACPREKFRLFCGTAGTTGNRLNCRAAGDLFSRVSAKKIFGVFLVFFLCFVLVGGVFLCFGFFLSRFSRVSAKKIWGYFFAVPQGISAISPLLWHGYDELIKPRLRASS